MEKAPRFCVVRCNSVFVKIETPQLVSTKLVSRTILDEDTKLVKTVCSYVPVRPYPWESLSPYSLKADFLLSQGLPLGDFINLRHNCIDACALVDDSLSKIIDSSVIPSSDVPLVSDKSIDIPLSQLD